MRKSGTKYDLAFVLGQRGSKDNNLIKEEFIRVALSISYNGIWFVKKENMIKMKKVLLLLLVFIFTNNFKAEDPPAKCQDLTSVYYTYYETKSYSDALPAWSWVLIIALIHL